MWVVVHEVLYKESVSPDERMMEKQLAGAGEKRWLHDPSFVCLGHVTNDFWRRVCTQTRQIV